MAHRLIKANYKKFYNDINYGQPAVVAIWLDKNDYDVTTSPKTIYPAVSKEASKFTLDENGAFTDTNSASAGKLSLWCNAAGHTGSKYHVLDPDGFE